MRTIAFIAVTITAILLFRGMSDLPAYGDPDAPVNAGPLRTHYVNEIETETNVPNLVTAVLADYRAYDTMFETVVIFTAGIAIIAILKGLTPLNRPGRPKSEPDDLIIQTTCRLLIPVIQIYALYVLIHGHHSPGGGFQGGVIMGASFILYALAYNLPSALERFSRKSFLICATVGVSIFAGFGVVAMLLKGEFLDYSALHQLGLGKTEIYARYHSMLGVEVGVFMTCTAIMFAIYSYLSTRGALKEGL
tara:strand:+ start:23389 stop:24135 length:747 start_codon:yes stop_codon:yes gene_type:complete